MRKFTTYFLLFFVFSCISDDRPRASSYFSWSNNDFKVDIKKGYTTLDMCPVELTLKNLNSKNFSTVYAEFTAYDKSEINIGSTNFLVSIGANEILVRKSYITKSCYYIEKIKLSKFTFR